MTASMGWGPRPRIRHGVSTLVSVGLHVALLLAATWVSVRPPRSERELVRVTLREPGPSGDGGAAPRRAATVAEPVGPPIPPPLPVTKAAPVPKPAAPRAVRAKQQIRTAPPPVTSSVASEVAAPAALPSESMNPVGAGAGAGIGSRGPGGVGSGAAVAGEGVGGADEMELYLSRVRAWIERAKRYPRRARRAGIEGRVTVAFAINEAGQPERLQLRRADHAVLGAAALQAIRDAAPFPRQAGDSRVLDIEVPLRFSLKEELEDG